MRKFNHHPQVLGTGSALAMRAAPKHRCHAHSPAYLFVHGSKLHGVHWNHMQHASPSHNAQTTSAQPNLLPGTRPDWAQSRHDGSGWRVLHTSPWRSKSQRRSSACQLACARGFPNKFHSASYKAAGLPIQAQAPPRGDGLAAQPARPSSAAFASHPQIQGRPRRHQQRPSLATRRC